MNKVVFCMTLILGSRKDLFSKYLSLVIYFLQTLYVCFRRRTKHTGIFTAELRSTFISDPKCDISSIR